MKKTTLIILIVVILLILCGGAYYFAKRAHNSSQNAQTAMMQNQTPQMSTQKKSLFDFLSMTGSLKCTFSDTAKSSSGTVYVSSGKMRGDFQSTNDSKAEQTHMVNDSKFVYIWTEGQKTGYKMSLDTLKSSMTQNSTSGSSGSSGQPAPSGPVDFHSQTSYSCGPAAVDASLFTVPQDITFADFSSMMHGVTPPQGGMTSQQKQSECSQCNQVPAGAMRNQCLSALHC